MSSAPSRDLNALLGSRICHDLISPLGAIGNGVELLALSGIESAPEIALIAESVENANARIRFFRIAFGASGAGQSVPISEIRSVLSDMGRGTRLQYSWEPEEQLLRTRVKLAFLVLQCLESAMPWGGTARVAAREGNWIIEGSADRLKIEPTLWNLLVDSSDSAELTPANVHFALVAPAARDAGCTVRTDLTEDQIRVSF